MNKGLEFLDKIYKDLYKSVEVEHSTKQDISKKLKRINDYLIKLERVHQKAIINNKITLLKEFYYDKYVIKKENIPANYLEAKFDQIINEQKESLNIWLDFFISDSKSYPTWVKYWAFKGMLKIGNYNKKTGNFNKRDKNTLAPFIELNKEALIISMNQIIDYLDNNFNENSLKAIIKNGSFPKIYQFNSKKVLSKNKLTNEGKWIKYEQESVEDLKKLIKSLQGKGTNWCTTNKRIAKYQLGLGDFYVYYTYDEKQKPTIPRLAIRMENDEIFEIRGLEFNQNIESDLIAILAEKLEEFPNKKVYKKKVNDMKILTYIYNKWKSKQELTLADLSFLYQVDDKISYFGYDQDPRINEILINRNQKSDLARIFNCEEKFIGFTESDLTRKLKYFHDNINLNIETIETLELPQYVRKNVYLNNLISIKKLKLPKYIGGDLRLNKLVNVQNLKLPDKIKGSLYLNNLTSIEVLPKAVGKSLYLSSLTSFEGLTLPSNLLGSLDLRSLTHLDLLEFPQTIDNLYLSSLTSSKALKLPSEVKGNLDLSSLITIEGLTLPEFIGKSLYLNSLINIKNVQFQDEMEGSLYLNSLKSAQNLKLPYEINGNLNLSSLINNLKLPEFIGGDLDLRSLTKIKKLPEFIGGTLYLNNLLNIETIKLPKYVGKIVILGEEKEFSKTKKLKKI